MTEHTIVEGHRLGKVLDPPQDPRTLRLTSYLNPKALAPAPTHAAWSPFLKTPWPMYLNDQLGDCVIADMGHSDELWLAAGGSTLPPVTDSDVKAAYSAITGYDPLRPDTDQGTVILDAMRWWKTTGIKGRRIAAYAEVDVHNHALVVDGIYYLAGLTIGIALPIAAQRMGGHWTRPRNLRGSNAPGSWGGHCVYVVDYDRYGCTVVSWGGLIKMSWGFWNSYVDEAWAPLSAELLTATGRDVHGFNLGQLQADLASLGQVR